MHLTRGSRSVSSDGLIGPILLLRMGRVGNKHPRDRSMTGPMRCSAACQSSGGGLVGSVAIFESAFVFVVSDAASRRRQREVLCASSRSGSAPGSPFQSFVRQHSIDPARVLLEQTLEAVAQAQVWPPGRPAIVALKLRQLRWQLAKTTASF